MILLVSSYKSDIKKYFDFFSTPLSKNLAVAMQVCPGVQR